jgi:hypothetical protein
MDGPAENSPPPLSNEDFKVYNSAAEKMDFFVSHEPGDETGDGTQPVITWSRY